MHFLLIFVVLNLALSFVCAEIKLVNVLFRHGDRTPGHAINCCPKCCDSSAGCNQTMIDNKFYPIGLGRLTNEGKQRVYELGKYLRVTYDSLLGEYYRTEEVEAVSSDAARTRMSLQLVLAGLYPPSSVQKWNDQLNWQPTLTSFKPKAQDTIFVPQKCEIYAQEYKRVLKSPEFKQQMTKTNMSEFLVRLKHDMGRNNECSLSDANRLYHDFAAFEVVKMPIPTWATAIYPDGQLRLATLMQYQLYGYNDLLRRLAGGKSRIIFAYEEYTDEIFDGVVGVLLKKVIDDMKNIRESQKKIYMYSGHETNVVMLLQTMGIYDNRMPEYSSAVIVELHEIDEKYFVKILYYHGVVSKVDVLKITGCEELCPLDQFIQLLQHVIPSDDDLDCRRIEVKGSVVSNCK